jgi:hypothetical protein
MVLFRVDNRFTIVTTKIMCQWIDIILLFLWEELATAAPQNVGNVAGAKNSGAQIMNQPSYINSLERQVERITHSLG